jgi:hypothetical protein
VLALGYAAPDFATVSLLFLQAKLLHAEGLFVPKDFQNLQHLNS